MDEWFCDIAGREIGPLSSHQLKAMAAKGQILPTDNVRHGATGHWVAANQVRGLFAAGQSPPPAESPPAEAPPTEPPSFFASLPPLPQSVADVPQYHTEPSVAWSDPVPTEPAAPSPYPPPPASPLPDVAEDDAVPFDIFAEPSGHVAPTHASTSIALLAHARRKRQQQMLLAGSLVFVILGIAMAGLFLASGRFSDLTDVKQGGGLSGIKKRLEKVATQKPADESIDQPAAHKIAASADSSKAKAPKGEDIPADDAALRMVVGDVPVRIVSAVRGGDEAGTADSQRLLVTIEVKNPSAQDRLDFTGWSRDAGQAGLKLTDDQGKTYPAKPIDAAAVLGKPVPSWIEPNESARDVVAFELPDSKREYLLLDLPGAAFGKNATAGFRIAAKSIVAKPVVVKLTPSASVETKETKAGSKPKKHRQPRPGTPEADFGLDEEEDAPR